MGVGVGVGRVVSQPGTGLMWCEYSLNFSELSFSSTPVKNGAGSAPQMGSGDKGDLNRVPGEGGAVPSSASCLVHPHPWGNLIWAAVQDGSSPGLLLILGCHLSVSLSVDTPLLKAKFWHSQAEMATAEKWEPWGLPLSRWGLPLSHVVLIQKEAGPGRGGVWGLAGVCRCPGSQSGEWWEGLRQPSFTS